MNPLNPSPPSHEALAALESVKTLQTLLTNMERNHAKELAGARRLALTGFGVATTALGVAGAALTFGCGG